MPLLPAQSEPPPAPAEEIARILAPHPIFAGFDRESLLAVAAQCRFATYPAGTMVMREGEPSSYALMILEGEVDVLIELPAGSDLTATLGVGGIRCTGTLGGCRLRTGAGDLQVEQAESLSLTTGMGLAAAEVVTGDAKMTTGSGKVLLRSVNGPAAVKNGNGETWVGDAGGDLDVKSANGDIVADRPAASMTANTANGDIRVHELVRGSATLQSAAGRIEIGIRRGTAARLDVHTQYGRVRNEMTAADGPAGADEQAEVRARTSFGDILIHHS